MFNYVVDSVDATAEMQTHVRNKIAHMQPPYNGAITCYQLHAYKKFLSNWIISTNLG